MGPGGGAGDADGGHVRAGGDWGLLVQLPEAQAAVRLWVSAGTVERPHAGPRPARLPRFKRTSIPAIPSDQGHTPGVSSVYPVPRPTQRATSALFSQWSPAGAACGVKFLRL